MSFYIFLTRVLKNGKQITFELASGVHTLEVGMTGAAKGTKVTVNLDTDKRIVCNINPVRTVTNGLAAGPAILEDEQGICL
ncbi:MAG: hypothetical protein LIO62_06670 [Clostridiales bacterium]|nr:hypothetical protein [Clostridiales bacterium]